MIIIGFDSVRSTFLTASGAVSDEWVLDALCNQDFDEFDLTFSSVALCAAVSRFRDLPLDVFKEVAR